MPPDSAIVRPLQRSTGSGPRRTRLPTTSRRSPTARARPTTLSRPPDIAAVVVAIPARDEAANIARSLRSIDAAAATCAVPVAVVIAADTCHDETAGLALATPTSTITVRVAEGRWRGAGRARAAAVEVAMTGADPARTWIANTDADCVVPSGWLQRQLRHAQSGAHAVAGIVTLDRAMTPAHLMAQFTATYKLSGRNHRHVHAANFGVRGDAYGHVGGWSTHTVLGEDHDLWRRLVRAGLCVVQPTDVSVTTSSRTSGRIVGGFASALRRLERHESDDALTAS